MANDMAETCWLW
jgi:hypothetical protein